MTKTLDETPVWEPVVHPSGSDLSNAITWREPLQALANGVAYNEDVFAQAVYAFNNSERLRTDVQLFTESGTWNPPGDAEAVLGVFVALVAGGEGGGGGGRAVVASGGAGGHSGGRVERFVPGSLLTANTTVTIGQGGAGGPGNIGGVPDSIPGEPGQPTTIVSPSGYTLAALPEQPGGGPWSPAAQRSRLGAPGGEGGGPTVPGSDGMFLVFNGGLGGASPSTRGGGGGGAGGAVHLTPASPAGDGGDGEAGPGGEGGGGGHGAGAGGGGGGASIGSALAGDGGDGASGCALLVTIYLARAPSFVLG